MMHAGSRNFQRILVAIEDDDCRALYTTILCERGFDVTTVGNPADGLAAAIAGHPDLIVTDYPMRSESGETLPRLLRIQPETRAVPIVTVSSWTDGGSIANAYHDGVDLLLPVPITPLEFMDELVRFFELWSRTPRARRHRLRSMW
jgi:CheY-like chemotaxis protein